MAQFSFLGGTIIVFFFFLLIRPNIYILHRDLFGVCERAAAHESKDTIFLNMHKSFHFSFFFLVYFFLGNDSNSTNNNNNRTHKSLTIAHGVDNAVNYYLCISLLHRCHTCIRQQNRENRLYDFHMRNQAWILCSNQFRFFFFSANFTHKHSLIRGINSIRLRLLVIIGSQYFALS